MLIEFSDNLLTGNNTIDTQHRELIGRIAAFVSSCEEGDGKMKAIKMLDYLAEYTEFHFSEEEKLQQEVSYPGFKEHKEKHEEFKRTVDALHEFLEESEGPTEGFDRSVAEYINYVNNPGRL